MISALLLIALAQVPGGPPGADNRNRVNSRFRFFGSNATAAAAGCSPACVSPQYCVGTTCTDPQFSFATASGMGMTAECAGTALTSVQGGAVTFTRASSAYCTIGNTTTGLSNASMVLLTTDAPRVMKGGPGTGPVGLMMELAGTNQLLRSQAFDNAVWSPTGLVVAAPTITVDQAVAPDGSTTAERMQLPAVDASGLQASYIFQAGTTTGTVSSGIYLKGNGTSGTLYSLVGPVSGVYTCTACPYVSTSWSRCAEESITTTSAAIYFLGVYGSTYGCGEGATAAQDVFIWQADMQAGAVLTSPILTTSAAATRAVEVATAAYTAAGGTVSTSVDAIPPSTMVLNTVPVSFWVDASNAVRLFFNTATGATQTLVIRRTLGGVGATGVSSPSFVGGSQLSLAGYYDGANFGSCVGGVCNKSAQSVSLATGAGNIYLGNSLTANLQVNGVVKNVCVDPTHCPSYGL